MAWNFKDEIIESCLSKNFRGKFIIPLPNEPYILDSNEIHYITTIDITSISEDLYNDIKGCTYPLAVYFTPYASINDTSCTFRLLGDLNDDGLIDIRDVIIIISFSTTQLSNYQGRNKKY